MHLLTIVFIFGLFLFSTGTPVSRNKPFWDDLRAINRVAMKDPRDRLKKPNLQRAQTTVRQAAPLFHTNSLPSSKMRADQARRAGSDALQHKKNIRDGALQVFVRKHQGSLLESNKRYHSALSKLNQATTETDKLLLQLRTLGEGNIPALQGKLNKAVTNAQKHKVMAWMQRNDAGDTHNVLSHLTHIGYGPAHFYEQNLKQHYPDPAWPRQKFQYPFQDHLESLNKKKMDELVNNALFNGQSPTGKPGNSPMKSVNQKKSTNRYDIFG